MIPAAAKLVVERMREACLDGVRLVSDRLPKALRIDEHPFGPPAVWLHSDPADVAWVIVDIGPQDWSKLAYQFGHELGHVMANSWQRDAWPATPCQWLEEAMVEAFSIRGLKPLAAQWKQDPPFANDGPFGEAIAAYRQNILQKYGKLGQDQGVGDFAAWFASHRADIEAQALGPYAMAASLTVLAEYERVRVRRGARRLEPLARPHGRADRRLLQPVGSELPRAGGLAAPAGPAARAAAGGLSGPLFCRPNSLRQGIWRRTSRFRQKAPRKGLGLQELASNFPVRGRREFFRAW